MFDNIHPLIVHVPIAFLGFYAVLEILRFQFLTRQPYWFYLKAVLVIVGTFASWVAILSGDAMSGQFRYTAVHQIIEIHETYGQITALLFSGIASAYIVEWVRLAGRIPQFLKFWNSIIVETAHWLVYSRLLIFLVIIGLTALGITGALGAAMVFGPESDPFVKLIYHLFFN